MKCKIFKLYGLQASKEGAQYFNLSRNMNNCLAVATEWLFAPFDWNHLLRPTPLSRASPNALENKALY
jgi:hypothetical protein